MNVEEVVAEQATGCLGAGSYRAWAYEQGYDLLEVVDWTSSAGDWTFIVSKDAETWYLMFQSNNWPKAGFTRTIDKTRVYHGTGHQVLTNIYAEDF